MSSVVAIAVIGLSDTVRPLMLIGFVVLLFAVAGVAVVAGKRRIEKQQAKALSIDAGLERGSMQGADASHSDAWLSQARDEVDTAPRQNWQDLILGPGSVHEDASGSTTSLAPEIAVQRASASIPHATWPDADEPVWGSSGDESVGTWAEDVAQAPEFPANGGPALVNPTPETQHIDPGYASATSLARDSIDSDEPFESSTQVGQPGRHAARSDATTPRAPFLVDNFLDDED